MKIKINIFQKYFYVAVQNVRTRINVLFCKQNWNRKMQKKIKCWWNHPASSMTFSYSLQVQEQSYTFKSATAFDRLVFYHRKKYKTVESMRRRTTRLWKITKSKKNQLSLCSMWFSFSLKENAILWYRVVSYVF